MMFFIGRPAFLFSCNSGSASFWLMAIAFVALLAMQAAYWLVTHPVNNFWLKDLKPKGFGARFFAFDPLSRAGDAGTAHRAG